MPVAGGFARGGRAARLSFVAASAATLFAREAIVARLAAAEVVVVAARTPEAAQAAAEEGADRYGCRGLSAVSVTLVGFARTRSVR
jgi:hypothetical protein